MKPGKKDIKTSNKSSRRTDEDNCALENISSKKVGNNLMSHFKLNLIEKPSSSIQITMQTPETYSQQLKEIETKKSSRKSSAAHISVEDEVDIDDSLIQQTIASNKKRRGSLYDKNDLSCSNLNKIPKKASLTVADADAIGNANISSSQQQYRTFSICSDDSLLTKDLQKISMGSNEASNQMLTSTSSSFNSRTYNKHSGGGSTSSSLASIKELMENSSKCPNKLNYPDKKSTSNTSKVLPVFSHFQAKQNKVTPSMITNELSADRERYKTYFANFSFGDSSNMPSSSNEDKNVSNITSTSLHIETLPKNVRSTTLSDQNIINQDEKSTLYHSQEDLNPNLSCDSNKTSSIQNIFDTTKPDGFSSVPNTKFSVEVKKSEDGEILEPSYRRKMSLQNLVFPGDDNDK